MKVILTHEQADMDALASQLGAWLIHPDAIPVLPRNINRNGRRFLARFGKDLPYIEYKDLPREPIETIYLVDTQSLITLKGMSEETKIVVYDHHPIREEINPNWELHLVKSGANASQMVSIIQKNDILMTPLQATTLALGLYEDTGSFGYGSTTAEDLKAAAFCIASGANLDLVGQFLYPPLSPPQRKLYDRLMKHVHTFIVEEQTILAAKANAMDVKDEISSVAHKMRDVLNPDALLLFVSTQQGIRLVARSTSDQVDVSSIAEAMGGGGHKRAASALIRPDEHLDEAGLQRFLDACFDDMIKTLDQHVKPIVTVSSIMSKNPLILTPETPVMEAHRLMQRYGYEGYPVVSKGMVVGLLNRREVDRAIHHGLKLNVESLMAAGNVSIPANASLDALQSLMGSSGWGQVPVTSPNSDEIIGIVTRTDFLKTLMPKSELPSQDNVVKKLENAVPPARLALLRALASEADKIHLPIFVVGGFVRDLLMERPSLDFDIVVEGDAIFFAQRLADRFGGKVLSHRRFGTSKWIINKIKDNLADQLRIDSDVSGTNLPESLDLITSRTEFYEQPAALPTVESSSIKMDLHRRDFTINTLALRLDGDHFGKIYDYWGGLEDLHKGQIRVLHALSFVDDATRLLRAVRFEQRFGFQIEPRTLALMEESLPLLDRLTGARLRHEITLILAEPHAPAMLDRLGELGILTAIHPQLPRNDRLKQHLTDIHTQSIDPTWELPEVTEQLNLRQTLGYMVWLGRLPETTLNSIVSRLRFKSDLKKLLVATSRLNQTLPELTGALPSQIVHELEKAPRLALYAAHILNNDPAIQSLLWQYVSKWSSVKPYTSGADLRKIGLTPSPAYGRILSELRDSWLDGKLNSSAEEEALLSDLIAKEQQSHK